jgi:hypothetical protein
MGLPEPKPASYEDLFDLPEHIVGEIINGRLVTHPRPAPRHARSPIPYWAVNCKAPSTEVEAAPAAGGFWTNLKST